MARHIVCKESELPVGEMKPFKAGDTNILVYHLDDGFHVTQTHCTHVFAPLGRGEKALKTYSAVVEDGSVVVEV